MIHSLAYKTDVFLRRFEGEVLECEDYFVIRTPQNPVFRWGNFLLSKHPPTVKDISRWQAAFAQHFPSAKYTAFGWDSSVNMGETSGFIDAGFELDSSIVMTAKAVHAPPKMNPYCKICPLTNWDEWMALEHAINAAQPESVREGADYREFLERKGAEFARMVAAGHGNFWGAYLNQKLVASLGLFLCDGVGRFQWVTTHPEYRRQGLCGTLVFTVAAQALEEVETLVMVADPEYVAASIYESIGFNASEKQFRLEKMQFADAVMV
jgi:Acetyltransferase (GNAT) domain